LYVVFDKGLKFLVNTYIFGESVSLVGNNTVNFVTKRKICWTKIQN